MDTPVCQRQHHHTCTGPAPGRRGVRLPVVAAAVAVALVLGAVLASKVRIDVDIAVPTLPGLVAAELIRRFVTAMLSGRRK